MRLEPLTILILDDNSADRDAMRRLLERWNPHRYVVVEESSAESAIERMRNTPPDCIITEYHLPDMDWVEFVAKIRQPGLSDCAVVVVTGSGSEAIAARSIKSGAHDYLSKQDLTSEDLVHAIEKAIERAIERAIEKATEKAASEARALEAETESQRSEARLRRMIDANPAVLFTCVPYGDFHATYVNNSIQTVLGYAPEQFCEPGFWADHLHPEERDQLLADLSSLFINGIHAHDYRFRLRDGSYRWVHNALALVRGADGEPIEIVGVLTDVTERKQAEDALKGKEEQLRLAQTNADVGIWDWLPASGHVEWSPELQALFGLPPGTIRTYADWRERVHPDDIERIEVERDAALANRQPFDMEFRILHSSGEIRWLRSKGRAIYSQMGEAIRATGINVDITDRKQVEQQLQLATERFETALKDSLIVVFNQDCDLRYTWVYNPALGYDLDVVLGKRDHDLFERTEDADVTEAIKREVIRTGVSDRREVRIHANSVDRYYHLQVDPLRGSDGQVTGVTCAAVDITERKHAEERLRRSEERFRIAEQASHSFVYDYNPLTGAEERTEGFTRLLGYSDTEIPSGGEMWETLIHPEDLERVRAATRQAEFANPPVVRVEYRLRHKNGAWIWVVDEFTVMRDAQGSVTRIVGSILDISTQKQQQQEIAELNIRLQRAVAETHHRVKNNLQMLSALVDVQIMDSKETVPLAAIHRIKDHISALSSLHDLLTWKSRFAADQTTISLKDALEKLTPVLQASAGAHEIRTSADEIAVSLKQSSAFVLLVNELVSNALKHGRNRVDVTLSLLPATQAQGVAGMARLEVCDDGPGFPANFDPGTAAHTGLELIESLGRWDLRGDIVYDNREEGGARVTVIFPLSDPFAE